MSRAGVGKMYGAQGHSLVGFFLLLSILFICPLVLLILNNTLVLVFSKETESQEI